MGDDDDGGGDDGDDDDGGGVDDDGGDDDVRANASGVDCVKLRTGSLLARMCLPRAVVGSGVLRRSTFWFKKGSIRGQHLSPTHRHPAHTGPCRNEGTRKSPSARHVVGIASESQGHP